MRITTNVRIVLLGVLRDAEDLASPNSERSLNKWSYDRFGVVPFRSRQWLGRAPSRSEESSISRTVGKMEQAGLVVRKNLWDDDSRRATHISLTDAGEKLAKQIREETK